MIGLLVLSAVALWLVISRYIAKKISSAIKASSWQKVTKVVVFSVLAVAPISDQIIGSIQFKNLCDNFSKVYINPEWKSANKVEYTSTARELSNTVIPIVQRDVEFLDIKSGEIIFSYKLFVTHGGFLLRKSFEQGTLQQCRPPAYSVLYELVSIKQ